MEHICCYLTAHYQIIYYTKLYIKHFQYIKHNILFNINKKTFQLSKRACEPATIVHMLPMLSNTM